LQQRYYILGEHGPVIDQSADRATDVYLDVCALNRPFDDQQQLRIRLETDAVLLILANVRTQALQLCVSPVHRAEIAATPDPARKRSMRTLLDELGVQLSVDRKITRQRAQMLHAQGMGVADAAHVAYAEAAKCDFISVDDRLLRQCRRIGLQIWFGTPMAFCDKEKLR
jgi:predicted nucleic acid-binding protein